MTNAEAANLVIDQTGTYILDLWVREDGLRVDKLLLTTDTTYVPSGLGLVESQRQTTTLALGTLARTIDYDYDDLYRLTQADYTTGENYQYSYDPVGNRLQQIINGDTTSYNYDAANRIATAGGVSFSYDDNGNLLTSDAMTNTWDAANRAIAIQRLNDSAIQELTPEYDGLGNRVAQTKNATTTYYALDVAMGLPEVIYTSEGNTYLHLAGVMMTENATGTTRYLLSDGLGSVRHVVDNEAEVVSYKEYDPYDNPIRNSSFLISNYAFTSEWWEDEVALLYLRARWYLPETGTFLSVDPVESEPPYQYVRGNVINLTDPSGMDPCTDNDPTTICHTGTIGGDTATIPSEGTVIPARASLLPSPFPNNCTKEEPCQVIVGAKKVGNLRNLPDSMSAYHHYILVADPNNIKRDNFDDPEPYKRDPAIGSFVRPGENVTVYHFGAFSERVLYGYGDWFWGQVIPTVGLFQDSKDYLYPHQVATFNPVHELRDDDANCDDVLWCFRFASHIIGTTLFMDYDAVGAPGFKYQGTNSNTYVKTMLRMCGYDYSHTVKNVWAPGWDREFLLVPDLHLYQDPW